MPTEYSWPVDDTAPSAEVVETTDAATIAGFAAVRDMALNSLTGDIYLDDNGLIVFSRGAEAIASDVKAAWGTFLREWFLDTSRGVDYFGLVFVKKPDLGGIERELRRVALERDGVEDLSLQLAYDPQERQLTVTADVTPDYGEIFSIRFTSPRV